MKNQKFISIGELSNITGVHIKSLRYYGEIGILKPAWINPETNYRYYTLAQVGIVDAIQTCVELNIPLKEFQNYVEDNGEVIRFARLLEHGQEVARKKIEAIEKNMKRTEYFLHEVERGNALLEHPDGFCDVMPEHAYYVLPFQEVADANLYYPLFHNMYLEAAEAGHIPAYDAGIAFLHAGSSTERFFFLQLMEYNPEHTGNIYIIHENQYISRCSAHSHIGQAADIFPELFAQAYDKIVVELELFYDKYDVQEPVYEIACSLPCDHSLFTKLF